MFSMIFRDIQQQFKTTHDQIKKEIQRKKDIETFSHDPVCYGRGRGRGPVMTNGQVSAKLITATMPARDLNIIPQTGKDLFIL